MKKVLVILISLIAMFGLTEVAGAENAVTARYDSKKQAGICDFEVCCGRRGGSIITTLTGQVWWKPEVDVRKLAGSTRVDLSDGWVGLELLRGSPHASSGDMFDLISGSFYSPGKPGAVISGKYGPLRFTGQYIWEVPNRGADGNLACLELWAEDAGQTTRLVWARHDSAWRIATGEDRTWRDVTVLEVEKENEQAGYTVAVGRAVGADLPGIPFQSLAAAGELRKQFGRLSTEVLAYRVGERFESLVNRRDPFLPNTNGLECGLIWWPRGWRLKLVSRVHGKIGEALLAPSLEVDVRRYFLPGKVYLLYTYEQDGHRLRAGVERNGLVCELRSRGCRLSWDLAGDDFEIRPALTVSPTYHLFSCQLSSGNLTVSTEVKQKKQRRVTTAWSVAYRYCWF